MLAVILVHTSQKFHLPPSIETVCDFGQYGCQLFLLISGYLAYKSLKGNWLNFLKRRFVAIVPGYWLTIAIFLLLNFLWRKVGLSPQYLQNRSLLAICTNVLLLHGLVPSCNNNVVPGGWYVGTTAILYLLTPLLKKCLRNANAIAASILFSALLLCGNILFQLAIAFLTGTFDYSGNNHFLYFFFLNQLPVYVLGMWFAEFEENKNSTQLAKEGRKFWLGGFSILLICFGMSFLPLVIVPMVLPTLLGWSFLGIFIGCHAWCDQMNTPPSWYKQKIACLGRNSYGAYLIHSIFAYYLTHIVNKLLARVGIEHNFAIFVPALCVVMALTYFSAIFYGHIIKVISTPLVQLERSHSPAVQQP